jgi:hypothetical protein
LAKDPDARLKTVGDLLAMLPGDTASAVGFTPASVADAVLVSASANHLPASDDASGNGAAKPFAAAVLPASLPAASPPPVTAQDIEEPIWKAVRETWNKFKGWHGEGTQGMKPLNRALLMFALVVVCIYFGGEAIGLAIPVLICYGIYYVVWVSVIRPNAVRQAAVSADDQLAGASRGTSNLRQEAMTAAWHPPAAASPASRYARKVRERRIRASWRERAHQELAAKPLREKLAELFGSMLTAAMFAALAALVAPVLAGSSMDSGSLAVYLWLAVVGTLGSWAILVPTKFSEGKIEDQGPIRMMLLMLGGLVGGVAWWLANMLIVQVPSVGEPIGANWGVLSHEMLKWNMPHGGANASLAMYVTYFAFLFVILRWWRQAEFTRNQRLSLWSVVVCVFWAWLLQFFWAFPQPAGMLVAGVTAFATQLASPWLPPSRRRALSQEVEQTV